AAYVLGIERCDLARSEETRPPVVDPEHAVTERVRAEDDGADRSIETGRVTAAGEEADAHALMVRTPNSTAPQWATWTRGSPSPPSWTTTAECGTVSRTPASRTRSSSAPRRRARGANVASSIRATATRA